MLKPDPDDPLKLRRIMALGAAFNGFFIVVPLAIFANVHWRASADLCESILHYAEAIMTGLIAPYLYSAHKQEQE